jgi:hypothetical protein
MTKQELIAKIKEALEEQFEGYATICGDLEASSSPCISSEARIVTLVEILYQDSVNVGVYDTLSSSCDSVREYELAYEDLSMVILSEIANLLGLVMDAEENLQRLVDLSLEKIKEDVNKGDVTVIEELLKGITVEKLEAFLGVDEVVVEEYTTAQKIQYIKSVALDKGQITLKEPIATDFGFVMAFNNVDVEMRDGTYEDYETFDDDVIDDFFAEALEIDTDGM